jgi:uncharacterized RDD family membrane protein YckC
VGSYGLDPEDQEALRSTALAPRAVVFDYAGWWARVAAYVIDVVLLVVSLIVVVVIGEAISTAIALVLILLWVVATLIGYWTYFEGSESGQTPGKRALGIRVRTTSDERISYGQAFGRNLVARIIGLLPIVGLIDVLWPLWDSEKQCLHDKAASTIVVRV